MIRIKGNCTPQVDIFLDFDDNPNGLPVTWLWLIDARSNIRLSAAPLNKQAVNELITELQKLSGDM